MTPLATLALWMLQASEGPTPAPAPQPAVAEREVKAPKRGLGLLIAGGISLGVGLPLVIVSIAEALRCSGAASGCGDNASSSAAVLAIPGVVGFVVGVPLLGIGAARHEAWKNYREQHRLALRTSLVRTREAWTVGLELRF